MQASSGSLLRRRGFGAASSSVAPLPRRIALAVAAAVALHAGLIVAGLPASWPATVATVSAMTVRTVSAADSRPSRDAGETGPSGAEPAPATRAAAEAVATASDTSTAGSNARSSGGRDTTTGFPSLPAPRVLASASPMPAAPAAAAARDEVTALPPAPDYLLGVTLDPGPRALGDIEPEYPESAHLQEGTVVLRLLIGDTGHVDNVAVVRAEPKGLFEESAQVAFAKAQFEPGRAGGRPVKSQITVEVHFIPINRGSRISGRGY